MDQGFKAVTFRPRKHLFSVHAYPAIPSRPVPLAIPLPLSIPIHPTHRLLAPPSYYPWRIKTSEEETQPVSADSAIAFRCLALFMEEPSEDDVFHGGGGDLVSDREAAASPESTGSLCSSAMSSLTDNDADDDGAESAFSAIGDRTSWSSSSSSDTMQLGGPLYEMSPLLAHLPARYMDRFDPRPNSVPVSYVVFSDGPTYSERTALKNTLLLCLIRFKPLIHNAIVRKKEGNMTNSRKR